MALALPVAACDQLDRVLSVESPSRLPASELDKPENALLMVNSAVADFECALGAYIVAGGLIAGEFADASPTASRWSYDRRVINPSESHYSIFGCAAIGVYTPVSTARWSTDSAVVRLEGWTDEQVPDRQLLIARSAAYAGYSLLLLGEGFCSAAIDAGPELTSAQLFEQAEARFTKAIAAAQGAGEDDLLNLAYVGRARARIDQGNTAGAAADAALVPVEFVFDATVDNSSSRRNNRVFAQNNQGQAVSVGEAYRNLTVGAANVPDTRVEVTDGDEIGGDRVTPLFFQEKYDTLTTPLPIATGVEAQLILAEAQGGSAAILILNALRELDGLPALTAEESADVVAAVVEERRRHLFLEGQRLYDMRRFFTVNPDLVPLTPAAGMPYPKGGDYGDLRCMPLPDVERRNNPNIPDA